MLLRFCVAYFALWAICPKRLAFTSWRDELSYALCGLFGVTVYFLFENFSLTATSAAFTGIITGAAPLAVALAMWVAYKLRPSKLFVVGFVVAITGITLVTTSGGSGLQVTLAGGLLAVGATVSWGIYCVALRRIDQSGSTNTILITRRIFFWSLVSMLLCLPIFGFDVSDVNLVSPDLLIPLALLALLGSSLAYVAYNRANELIGAVKASIYIYFIPAINAIAAFFVLDEVILPLGIFGILLLTAGLIVSERGTKE
jgi:drug/metabolite transporter (DMT)-like permease